MKWPINPNKHRSLRKHADEISNLGLNIMTRWRCVSCRQSTKVEIVNCFTGQIMPCCDQRVKGPLHEKNFYPAVRVRLKERLRTSGGCSSWWTGTGKTIQNLRTCHSKPSNPCGPPWVRERERKKGHEKVAKKRDTYRGREDQKK